MKKTILVALLSCSFFSIQAIAQNADRIDAHNILNMSGNAENVGTVVSTVSNISNTEANQIDTHTTINMSAHVFNEKMLNAEPLAIDVKWVKHQKESRSFFNFFKPRLTDKANEQTILARDGFPISGAQTMDVSYLRSVDIPTDETQKPKFDVDAIRTGFRYAFVPTFEKEQGDVSLQYQLAWINLNSIRDVTVTHGFTVQNPDTDMASMTGQTKIKLNTPTVLMNRYDYDVVVTVRKLDN